MPEQEQNPPGKESQMTPKPEYKGTDYKAAGKLKGKVALITGGDSGIGRSVAVLFAREGADVAIVYNKSHDDAETTQKEIEKIGQKCVTIVADIGYEQNAQKAVTDAVQKLGHLDIVVNNAAEQHPTESITEITSEQLEQTFRTNIFSYFYVTKAALPHLSTGSTIINTTSVTAYRGSGHLLDYSSTKGAIVSFTRSLAEQLAEKKIRVNGVAPGPIWTPLIPSTFPQDETKEFGASQPLGRPGQPEEVAPSFVFLASSDSSYMTGQILHPNGGEVVNG
jgi:NAD(P)-dependent dehydrogenase (short-subunit alcohol dehydrogenase family)